MAGAQFSSICFGAKTNLTATSHARPRSRRKVIIDTDAGVDDAQAIIFCLGRKGAFSCFSGIVNFKNVFYFAVVD